MLQNTRVTAVTVSELLRENQRRVGGGGFKVIRPTRLGLRGNAVIGRTIPSGRLYFNFK